jgi:hypothetical protein
MIACKLGKDRTGLVSALCLAVAGAASNAVPSRTIRSPASGRCAAIASTRACASATPGSTTTAARSQAGSNEGLPKTFRRGESTFNRRFFETQFPSFFKVVASEADKDLVLEITTAAGVTVATRITRISAADLALKASDGTENTLEFVQVLEITLRDKNA